MENIDQKAKVEDFIQTVEAKLFELEDEINIRMKDLMSFIQAETGLVSYPLKKKIIQSFNPSKENTYIDTIKEVRRLLRIL